MPFLAKQQNNNNNNRLERIQRKAARICLHLPLFSPVDYSSLLHRLQLSILFSRRRIKQLLLSHSIFHHYAPLTYFSCNFLLLPLMFTPFATHVHIIFLLPLLIASKTPQYLERFTISIHSLKLWNQLKIALCLNLRFIPSLSVQSAPARTTLSPMSNLTATLTTLTISFFPTTLSFLSS